MTAFPLAEVVAGELARPRDRPTLFESPTWSAESATGRLFALTDEAACRRHCLELATTRLGDFALALTLLTDRERDRATLFLALADALFDVAASPAEGDDPERRIDDLNRIAFQIARSLRGEPTEALFVRLFAAESRRRAFTRSALDELFASARIAARAPRPENGVDLEVRAHRLGEAVATALLGAEPSPAVVELAAGVLRLARLQRLQVDLARGRSWLPKDELADPLQYRGADEISVAVTRECVSLHHLLLRGARAVGEVPLTFRRAVAFTLPAAIAILGLLEERPRSVARAVRRVGGWKLRVLHWRARYTPLG